MSVIRMLVVVFLALAAAGAQAQDAAVQRLTELLGRAQTLSGRFSQLSLDASGTQLQESMGELSLQRPGKFRWHTDAPMEQLLVSDGTTVWLYDPDLEQVTIQKLDQRLTHTPALLLSGNVSTIRENFDVSYTQSGEVVDFQLKPKSPDTLFDTLRLSFRSGVINDMQLIDSVGQRTNILFSGIEMNRPLDAGLFRFEVPQGVDVISE